MVLSVLGAMLLATAGSDLEEGAEALDEATQGVEEAAPVAEAAAGPAAGPAQTPTEPQEPEPTWWNGTESIYANSMYLSFGLVSGGFVGDDLLTEGLKRQDSTSLRDGALFGFQGDIGFTGRHFGLLALGGSYLFSVNDPLLDSAPVSIKAIDVRVLQPRLRLAAWRFELGVQAGPVAHLGWATLDNSLLPAGVVPSRYQALADSSFFSSLAVEVGGGLRFHPVRNLYVEAAYRHSFSVLDVVGEMEGMHGMRFAAGLSF